jgi:hypothetical protein
VLGNERARVRLHARLFDGVQRDVLTGDDSPAPFGSAAVHDNRVWLRRRFAQ